MLRTHSNRAKTRGAAMVEALIVISIFLIFWCGMVYFRSLYQQKLRVMRLARAAAVNYAMAGCTGDALASIQQDLGNKGAPDGTGSGQQQGNANPGNMNPNPSNVGNSNQTVGSALQGQGVAGDPISGVSLSARALAGGFQGNTWKGAFSGNPSSQSYMSCGEDQHDGTPDGMLSYIKGEFTSVF